MMTTTSQTSYLEGVMTLSILLFIELEEIKNISSFVCSFLTLLENTFYYRWVKWDRARRQTITNICPELDWDVT